MRTRTLFLAGVVLGAVMGVALLFAGTLTLLPGLVVWTWLAAKRPRFVGASGGLLGFGASWLLVFGRAAYRCTTDATCTQPDLRPWLGLGAALLVAGLALGLIALRRLRQA